MTPSNGHRVWGGQQLRRGLSPSQPLDGKRPLDNVPHGTWNNSDSPFNSNSWPLNQLPLAQKGLGTSKTINKSKQNGLDVLKFSNIDPKELQSGEGYLGSRTEILVGNGVLPQILKEHYLPLATVE